MANTILKFYRGAAPSSPAAGMIWFDKANSTIKVYTGNEWESYAGKIIDATWNEATKALTLVKQDGKSKEISFADVASASKLEEEITNRKSADAALDNRVKTLESATHVNSLGGKTGDITVDGAGQEGAYKVKLAMTNQQLGATITGLGTAAAKAVGDFDPAGAANDVKTALVGDAATEYNTLGKLEDKIQAEASRATAAEEANAAAAAAAKTAADNAQATADAKVASVAAKDGETAIEVDNTTATAPKISLKLDNDGNVQFVQTAKGLKGSVEIPEATVTGVKADDKFLSLADKLVSADVSIAYDADDKKIYLYGKDKTKANAVSSIDCRDFIKDGMLDSASLVTNPAGQSAGTYIKLTWNTDGGKQPMYINVTSLIDVYTAGNGLNLSDHEFSVNFDVAATKDSVDKVAGRVSTLEGKVGSAAVEGGAAATGLYKDIADNKAAIADEVDRAMQAEAALLGKPNTDTSDSNTIHGAKKYTDASIAALDATGNTSEAVKGVTVTVDETDGKVIKPVVSITDGTLTGAATDENLVTGKAVKNYVDGEITKVTKVETLNFQDKAEAGKFVTAVSQANGIITVSRAALAASDIPEIEIAKVTDLQTALDGKATSAQGALADTAIQEVTASGDAYVTAKATPSGKSVAIKVDSSAMKKYVDDKIANNTDLVWASFE